MLGGVILLADMAGIVFAISLLLLPVLVAAIRDHPNTLAVFMLNLMLGWTVVGWVAALIWACTSHRSDLVHLHDPAVSLDAGFEVTASAPSLALSAPHQGPR